MIDYLKILKTIFPYFLVIVLFFYLQNKSNNQQQQVIDMINSSHAPTVKVVDESGNSAYQTSQMRGDKDIFLKIDSGNDKVLRELQEQVKLLGNKLNNGGSVTKFKEEVKIDTTLLVQKKENGVNASFKDEWVDINNDINFDNTKSRTSVLIKNNYSVALIKEKGEYTARVKNLNPYSSGIEDIKTFVQVKEPKKFGIGVGLGYDVFKNELKPEFQLQYRILDLF